MAIFNFYLKKYITCDIEVFRKKHKAKKMNDVKKCRGCDKFLPLTLFYIADVNRGYYQSRCKKCYNLPRDSKTKKKKKPNKIDKLTDEQKEIFDQYYGKVSLRKFSEMIGINYNTLATFRSRGIIPKIPKPPKQGKDPIPTGVCEEGLLPSADSAGDV